MGMMNGESLRRFLADTYREYGYFPGPLLERLLVIVMESYRLACDRLYECFGEDELCLICHLLAILRSQSPQEVSDAGSHLTVTISVPVHIRST